MIGSGLVVVVVVGFAVIYFLVFPTSSPKPLCLTAAKGTTAVSSTTGLAGTWTIGSGSVAGYRVREKLGFLPAESDAVGRTSQITGDATVTEADRRVTVHKASFVIAVNTLKSDRSMRDQRIHTLGLQSDTYPKATFWLSTPVTLAPGGLSGKVLHVPVTGVLTIHGTSKRLTLPLEMTLSSSAIDAAGSLTFPWAEFKMTAPSVGGFVNVAGQATMEFDLHLRRS